MSDKMRELFEKWAIANGLNVSWRSGDDYLVDGTITAWAAWQAAQSAAVPVVGDYSVTQLQRLKSLMSNLGLSTDESLEGFCLDADRQLSRAITAMEKTLKALMSVPVVGDVVAWQYEYLPYGKDSKWRRSITMAKADAFTGAVRNPLPLYVKPTTSITADELAKIRAYIADGIESEGVTEHDHSIEARKLVKLIDAAIAGEKK